MPFGTGAFAISSCSISNFVLSLSIFLPTLSISLLLDLIYSGIISFSLVDLPLNSSFLFTIFIIVCPYLLFNYILQLTSYLLVMRIIIINNKKITLKMCFRSINSIRFISILTLLKHLEKLVCLLMTSIEDSLDFKVEMNYFKVEVGDIYIENFHHKVCFHLLYFTCNVCYYSSHACGE